MALPTFVAAGTLVGGTAGISVAWPVGGHQADDIGLLFVETANEAVTAPGGIWTEVTNSPQGVGTAADVAATRLTVYWARATSSSESNVSVADAGNHTIGVILTFRGCPTSGDPWDVTAGGTDATLNTSAVGVGLTTTVADCLVVVAAALRTDSASAQSSAHSNASLANLTERQDSGNISANGGSITVITGEKATAGAVSTTTWTLASSASKGYLTIALKPAASGTTLTPGVGDLTLEGFAPTLGLPITLTPGVGDITLEGFAPTISMDNPVTLAPGVGDLTLEGFAPTLGLPVTLAPGVGDLTLEGFVPTIGLPVTLSPGVGGITVEGFAPTIDVGFAAAPEPTGGFRRILYDADDERPRRKRKKRPEPEVPEVLELPDVPPAPEPESRVTARIRAKVPRPVAIPVGPPEDDDDEIEFLLHVLVDLD